MDEAPAARLHAVQAGCRADPQCARVVEGERIDTVVAQAGGALRIVSSFVPYEAGSVALEALYGVIDLCLLSGLLAVYVANAEAVGIAGLAMFLVASIPMMEQRSLQRRPDYQRVIDRVSRFMPMPPHRPAT